MLQEAVLDIPQDDPETILDGHLGNPMAHGARPYHAHGLDIHGLSPN
jgi:hypothetical protein